MRERIQVPAQAQAQCVLLSDVLTSSNFSIGRLVISEDEADGESEREQYAISAYVNSIRF